MSSPYTRAYQSVVPLAERLGICIETDDRLIERIFSGTPLPDWRERLAASYADVDLCLPGGESSRTAMTRGVAAIEDIMGQDGRITAVASHGNMVILILKHFDDAFGFEAWERMTNPDVYCLQFVPGARSVQRLLGFWWNIDVHKTPLRRTLL